MVNKVEREPNEPYSKCDVRLSDGVDTTLRRYGNPDGPRLVLSHGNGLAIDLYYPFWSLLSDDFDLLVYDLRNHGWNTVGPRKLHNIATFLNDLTTILESIDECYGNKPKIGVFHSISALVALLYTSAARNDTKSVRKSAFSAQILFDPPLGIPDRNRDAFEAGVKRAATAIRRRAFRFEKSEDFVELLRHVPAISRTVTGTLELMAKTLLRMSSNAQAYELRCPREYEAQIMDMVSIYSSSVDLDLISCPTKIIGADPTLPFSYFPTSTFDEVSTVDYEYVPGTTHFLQLENPNRCATVLRKFLARQSLI